MPQAPKRRYDNHRGSSAERGYGSQWRKARYAFLCERPLCECEECKAAPMPELAEVVDHIVPHKGDMRLFWDQSNWRAMSKQHHDRKTAREDRIGRRHEPTPSDAGFDSTGNPMSGAHHWNR